MLSLEEYELAKKVLTLDEGKSLKVYRCTANKLTVSIGCNIEANDTTPIIGRKISKFGETITELESDKLFKALLDKVGVAPLYKNIPDIMNSLDSIRKIVLVDLCFNMGWGTLDDFKNTLKFIKLHDFKQAAKNLKLSKWYTQVGHRGPRITYMLEYGKLHPDYD
jgi:lysozyme